MQPGLRTMFLLSLSSGGNRLCLLKAEPRLLLSPARSRAANQSSQTAGWGVSLWIMNSHRWSLYTLTDHLYIQSLILFIYSHWSSLYTVTDPLYIQSLIIFIYSHWSSLYTVTGPLYIQSLIIFIYSHWSSLYTVTDHLYIQSLMVFIYIFLIFRT